MRANNGRCSGRTVSASNVQPTLYPPCNAPPPCNPAPPPGGNGHLAQKALKILGAKENFYKAPKLIHTVILWYSFVVQSPPPPGGELSLRDCRPPVGGNCHDIGEGGSKVLRFPKMRKINAVQNAYCSLVPA